MQVFVKQFHSQQTLLRVFLYRLQQCDKAFPQGEGAERSEADEGQSSTDWKKIFIVRLNPYPHQSKIRDF